MRLNLALELVVGTAGTAGTAGAAGTAGDALAGVVAGGSSLFDVRRQEALAGTNGGMLLLALWRV
eukprot:4919573-Heterocapsa_arctica.AAC.1